MSTRFTWFASLILLLISGCAGVSITPTPTVAPTSIPVPTTTPLPTASPVILRWQGHTDMGTDGDATRCKQLEITNTPPQVQLGYCDQTLKSVPANAVIQMAQQFSQHLGRMDFKTDQDQITLFGTGTETDKAWQPALVRWVHLKYAELDSQHACASCPTVFNWFWGLPNETALCAHVYVTDFGYATAENIKCHPQGDTPQKSMDGFLETSELQTLNDWLANRGQFQDGDNYFNGEGSQAITAADATAMETWAKNIYQRLLK